MSTAAPSWSASSPARRFRLAVALWLVVFCSFRPCVLGAQSTDRTVAASRAKAQQVLQAAIEALGGKPWRDVKTVRFKGRTAAFFQGKPTGAQQQFVQSTELPNKSRIDFAPKGHVAQIYVGDRAWEITYKGEKNLPAAQAEDHLRWHRHSLGVILRQWERDPATMLIERGQSLVARRLADNITLISTTNDAATIAVDAETHLPLRLTFEWRDPRFHDKNVDTVEYNNYHRVDGIETPFTITRTQNGQTVRQRYLESVEYNVTFRRDLFDPAAAAAKLK